MQIYIERLRSIHKHSIQGGYKEGQETQTGRQTKAKPEMSIARGWARQIQQKDTVSREGLVDAVLPSPTAFLHERLQC